MIVIDKIADIKLTKRLEQLRIVPDATRCVYFKLMGKETPDNLREKIIATLQANQNIENLQIYFCDDGDIFILAPNFSVKDGNSFIWEIASYLQMKVDSFANFYETSSHINRLLLILEQKFEQRQQDEELRRKKNEQLQTIRKRQNILNISAHENYQQIKNRREKHDIPELLIIEDDAFSCRLVEKVLEKKYPLTALHEATNALETYARIAPDILFLDINLPDVTGHELLERIIKIDPEAYVIMLSGNADKHNIMQAMSHGAKGFIAKPFTRDKLFQYIERCPTINHESLATI
jgi:two-component system chemotaxis response regulator CheY